MGNGSVIGPGDVQRMSAGSGVRHSEFNRSRSGVVHFLQIWIEPDTHGIAPGYEEKYFDNAAKRGKFCLIASCDARNGSVKIHQDAAVYAALVDGGERITNDLESGRRAYVFVARGSATVNGQALDTGDALKITGENRIAVENGKQAELLLFDLA